MGENGDERIVLTGSGCFGRMMRLPVSSRWEGC